VVNMLSAHALKHIRTETNVLHTAFWQAGKRLSTMPLKIENGMQAAC